MLFTLLLLMLTVGVAAAQPGPDSSEAEGGS